VFAEEMGIDESLDFDGTDAEAIHAVALRGQAPIATGRLIPAEGRLGRMAVLAPLRRLGVGSELLDRLLREAVRAGVPQVSLHAQDHAIGFYRRHGFESAGPLFEEAGIPHQRMQRQLKWMEAVAAIICRGGRVLLGLRAPHLVKGGYWDLFGGEVEAGETAEEACVRELEEETALRVKPEKLLDVILYEDGRGLGRWRCPVYRIVQWNGSVKLNEEHSEARWVHPDEMSRLRLAHHRIVALAREALAGIE
jgi:8-oxo-dGTP pyrophosphatase MutT (NUDIX family)/predicted GNAT family N-acyltransferase